MGFFTNFFEEFATYAIKETAKSAIKDSHTLSRVYINYKLISNDNAPNVTHANGGEWPSVIDFPFALFGGLKSLFSKN